MFRLLKLIAYGLFGYFAYEFLLGATQRTRRTGRLEEATGGRPIGEREQAMNAEQGRAGTLTGAGRGATERSEDLSGTSTPHIVGRGVTST